MANIDTAQGGYKDEVTYGIRPSFTSGTTTLKFGVQEGGFPIPVAKPVMIAKNISSSKDVDTIKFGKRETKWDIDYQLVEGKALQYVMGQVSEGGGGGPTYVHTITGTETGAVIGKSRYAHIETDGLTSDKIVDVTGIVTEKIDIGWDDEIIGIFAKETLMAQRIVDETATTNLLGQTSGGSSDDEGSTGGATSKAIVYTAGPAFSSGVTEETSYRIEFFKFGATDIISQIQTGNIRITNKIEPSYSNRNLGKTDNYGKSINAFPSAMYLINRRIGISITCLPNDDIMTLYERLNNGTLDNDITIQFTRSVGGNTHTILFTFDTTYCPVMDISGLVGFALENNILWTLVFFPKNVTITVTDADATI